MKWGALALAPLLALAAASEARAVCAPRPTIPNAPDYTYGAAEVRSYTTPRARVFYATSGPHAPSLATTRADGVPDTVAFAGDTAEDALERYEKMGYRRPVPDTECAPGGASTVDIYLVKFAGADGTTMRDSCQGHACASWVYCEATFAGRAYASAQEGFKTVVPHEVFHVVQNAYDADLDRFWAEGTAQWAMKTLHPELMDLERNLPAFFTESARSIDVPPPGAATGFLYGAAVWPVFLTARQGDGFVREVLETEANGTTSLAAVDVALGAHGASLAGEFPLFVAWNACTGARAGTGGYASAATYPSIAKIGELAGTVSGTTSGLSNFTYHVSSDAEAEVSIQTDPARNGGVLVPLNGGKCAADKAAKLPARFQGEALVVVSGITTKKTDGPFTLTVGPPTADTAPDAGTGVTPTTATTGGCHCDVASRAGADDLGLWAAAAAIGAALRRRRRA